MCEPVSLGYLVRTFTKSKETRERVLTEGVRLVYLFLQDDGTWNLSLLIL
jgi:hypothetical protein